MISLARITWLAGAFCLMLAGFALGQDAEDGGPNYTEWRSVAVAAEQGLADVGVDEDELQRLRDLIDGWRDTLIAAEGTNAARVRTVEAQIDALGPAPAEEDPAEPAEIAQRRAELAERLAELQAPGRRASEALSEANGLIAEIDAEFRSRQAEDLLTRGPTPLNPANWLEIYRGLVLALDQIGAEVSTALESEDRRSLALELLPVIAILLVAAALMVGVVRRALERLSSRIQGRQDHAGAFALSFFVSLLQVVIPLIGIWLLTIVVIASAVFGPIGNALLTLIVLVASAAYVGRWMALKFFANVESPVVPLDLTPLQRAEGRTYTVLLWTLFPIFVGISEYAEAPDTDPQIIGILTFPLILIEALIVLRLGRLLIAGSASEGTEENDGDRSNFLPGVAAWIGRALRVVAIAAPVAGAVGYMNLADAMILRLQAATVLVALLTLMHFVIQDVYAVATRKTPNDVRDALVPVLLTLLLTIFSLPLFAVIIGARWSDVTNNWDRIRQGFSIGDLTISPGAVLVLLLIFAIGFAMTRFVQSTLRTVILPKTKLDLGARTAVISGVGYVGVTLAALIAITTAGINLSSLAIVAGALSVGIGFGLQTIVSNFVSGIILLVERPISEGDWIEVGPNMGIVKDISVRATRVETFDRRDVIIPNSDLVSGTVTNWTRNNVSGRIIISVGVSYDSDTRQVESILRDVAEAHPLVVLNPPPSVFFRSFGDNSLDFEVRAILRDINFSLGVQSELYHEILRRFREARINIPFPQRDIWLRRPGDTEDVKGAQMTDQFEAEQLGTGDPVVGDLSDLTDSDGDGGDR